MIISVADRSAKPLPWSGPVIEHPRDAHTMRAHCQFGTDRRAELGEQARIRPCLPGLRDVPGGPACTEGLVGDLEPAAQRIARAHRAQGDQRRLLAEEHDARHRLDARDLQPATASLGVVTVADRACRLETEVSGQDLARLLLDRATDAAREEPDRGQRGHRHEQREHQHGEFAGLEVTEAGCAARA